MSITEKTFGQTVRELRKRKTGYSLREFARLLGISAPYLSDVENDRRTPPKEYTIIKMSELLDADSNELLALAGKLPPVFCEAFVKNSTYTKKVPEFLHLTAKANLTEKQWNRLIDELHDLTSADALESSICPIERESIVAIWLFDESDEGIVRDASGNGHDGEIMGSLERVEGKFGQAIKIPNTTNDYILVADHQALRLTEAMTIISWVKKEVSGCTSCILGKDDLDVHRDYNLHICMAGSGKIYLSDANATGEAVIADGQWHHVAGTWDGFTIKLYIDGCEETSSDFSGPINTSHVPVKIGLLSHKFPFSGLIDELGVFNRALTEDEIRYIMKNGLGAIL